MEPLKQILERQITAETIETYINDKLVDMAFGAAGVILGALLALVLTMVWDSWKERRAGKKSYQHILAMVKMELENNLAAIEFNNNDLLHELTILPQGNLSGLPLTPLTHDLLEILKFNAADEILAETKLLEKLQTVVVNARMLNELMQDRRQLKIRNVQWDAKRKALESLNTELIDAMNKLRGIIAEAIKMVDERR